MKGGIHDTFETDNIECFFMFNQYNTHCCELLVDRVETEQETPCIKLDCGVSG